MANLEGDAQSAGGSVMLQQMAEAECAASATIEHEKGEGTAIADASADNKKCSGDVDTGGSSVAPATIRANDPKRSRTADASGESSPGTASSHLSADARAEHSRTPTSDESLLRRSISRDYNFSPAELDSDQEEDDELDKLLRMHAPSCIKSSSSVGVQTEHDEEFPSLKFLQSLLNTQLSTEALKMPLTYFNSTVLPHQQQMIPPPPLLPSVSTQQMDPSAMDDPNCTEGTLQLVIQNFRHMSDTVRGPSKGVQSVPWRIMVMPRQHVVQKKGTQKCLGFFLQCCPDAYSDSWSCQATAELRLISQKPGIPNFTRKTSHSYTAKENDWGYSCFMTWADILDETQGYIKDDKVVLEVYVKAEPPKNVLSHKEFQKKIQDYKRLADVQCQRGLIDKAIECNAQALKFCKDKDSLCKTELENQKAHLIEMKLKQSIERIEKGNDPTKGIEEDATSNIAALRSALSSGTKAKGATQPGVQKVKSNGAPKDSTTTNATNPVVKAAPTKVQSTKTQKGDGKPALCSSNGTKSALATAGPTTTTTTTTTTTIVDSLSTITRTKSRTVSESYDARKSKIGTEMSQHLSARAGKKCTHLDSKALIALGHFNKALLDSDELDYVTNFAREKYLEDEELLPGQIKHYLQHLSERGKEAARLKRFSSELEFLASPLDETSSGVEAFFNELLKMTPDGDGDMLDFEQIEQRLEQLRRKNPKRGLNSEKTSGVDELCDFCTFRDRKRRNKIETSENSCQTDFTRRLSHEDATARLMELHAQQQQIQQLQQLQHRQVQNLKPQHQQQIKSACNDNCRTPPSPPLANLPSKPRKKATAKKTSHPQQHPPPPPLQPPPPQLQGLQTLANEAEVNAPSSFLMPSMIPPTLMPPPPSNTADLPAYFQASSLNMNALTGLTPEMAAKLQEEATLLAAAQQQQQLQHTTNNLLSRQYIEEWLKLSKSPLGYSAIPSATGGKPLIVTRSDDGVNTQSTQIGDAATPSHGAHIGGLSCLNAKSIQQRLADFLSALESNSNIREMRNSVDRLLTLCNPGGDDTDTVSIVSTNDSSNRDPIAEAARDFPILPPSLQQGYAAADEDILSRELRQAEFMLATRLDALIYQLHSASLTDIVERVEGRVRSLVDRIREVEASDKAARSSVDALKNSELQAQKALQLVNEKLEKSNQQLKEKKNEIKKLEKRLKSETQLSEENGQLHEKVDSMKKELASIQKQLNEEQLRYKRDTQSLADSKKHLGVELAQLKSSRSSEAQKLANQLEERNSTLKKVESQLSNERKSNASTISSLSERVKRAEVALLEHKLEDGLKVLERAKEDCQMQIRSLEDQLRRHFTAAEQEVVKKNIAEWENKKEEVVALIAQANKDFAAHINSIKSGKQVSQLAKVQVPRPPPCPRLHPMPTPTAPSTTAIPLPAQHCGVLGHRSASPPSMTAAAHQQPPPPMDVVSSNVASPLPLERKVITPPSRGARGGLAGVQLPPPVLPPQPHHSPLPHPMGGSMGGMGSVLQSPGGNNSQYSNSNSTSANVTPIKFQQQAQSTAHLPPPPSSSPLSAHSHHVNAAIAPIGVRPANYPANGVAVTQHGNAGAKLTTYRFDMLASGSQFTSNPACTTTYTSVPSFASSCLQPQPPPPSAAPESVQLKTSQQPSLASNAPFQAWSGWGGVEQTSSGVASNISDIFGRGRSFGPLGSDFGNRSTTGNDANNGVDGTTGSGTVTTTSGFYS